MTKCVILHNMLCKYNNNPGDFPLKRFFYSTGTTSARPIVILAQMSDWMDTTR